MELIWQVIWISKMTSEHAKLAFPGLIKIDSVQDLNFRLGVVHKQCRPKIIVSFFDNLGQSSFILRRPQIFAQSPL